MKRASDRSRFPDYCHNHIVIMVEFCVVITWALGFSSVTRGHEQSGTAVMQAAKDPISGQIILAEGNAPILRYNYWTVEPGGITTKVSSGNLKYAKSRSNYIHPLYGPGGEELTHDWSLDHPHHRGIYWAWPEVMFGAELGDLHALQRVFARPTDQYELISGADYAQVEAENLWLWEDREAIVRETAVIRAYRRVPEGRFVDLEFHITALRDGITIARRETDKYGGLNIRLAPVEEQEIVFHTDGEGKEPRMAWAELSGVFSGGHSIAGLSVIQKRTNPLYPGDWIEYPELNWFQPTFPAPNTRYALKKSQPLVLHYRLWIHPGRLGERDHAKIWRVFDQASALNTPAQP
jgi:hypothetical protein